MTANGSRTENNISQRLLCMAAAQPWQRAVVIAMTPAGVTPRTYAQHTFQQLAAASQRYAWGLAGIGAGPGKKVLLMVRPSLDFYALTIAIFMCGAAPVLIDPGMGWRAFMRCVEQSCPDLFIGVPAAHVLRLFFRRSFRSVRAAVTLGRRWGWGGHSLAALPGRDAPYSPQSVALDDTAAVLFTSGSTGPAKGVVYTHGVFAAQLAILRREYGIGPGDIDLPCFPLFGLFSPFLGATAVIPHMDPTRPAFVDPRAIIDPILDHGATYSFGSPTLWARVGRYCADREISLPTLRRVIMAGAPVPGHVHDLLLNRVLPPGGQTFTPYGATESLPVMNFTGREMLGETDSKTRAGAGMCVGRPVEEVRVRIIQVDDGPIESLDACVDMPQGEIGEVIVSGPVVTRAYDNLPEATRLAKIRDGKNVWHRMGDLGYLDSSGRLWFCGRKAHRVVGSEGTLYSVCCEAIFNEIFDVQRSALVGVGPDRSNQVPVIVIQPVEGRFPRNRQQREAFRDTVLEVAAAHALTRPIRQVLFHPAFPVDIRHNAKIRREDLAAWAERKLGRRLRMTAG